MKYFLAIFWVDFCCLVASGSLFAQGGSAISGVIVDPLMNQGVRGMRVSVYSLDRNGRADKLIGRTKDPSNEQGAFDVKCDLFVERVEIQFYDPESATRGFMYGPVSFRSLSGRQNAVLNPAVFPSSADSPNSARERMRSLGAVLPNLKTDERTWASAYVVNVVRSGRDARDFGFGDELSSVIELLRPEKKQLAVSLTGVWLLEHLKSSSDSSSEEQKITGWQLPNDLTRPQVFKTEPQRVTVTPARLGTTTIAPSDNRLWVFHNSKSITGRAKPIYSVNNSENPDATFQWKPTKYPSEITAATGVAGQPLLITGTVEGSIIVTNSKNAGESATYEIGPTPTAATALSRDGHVFAAVTLDGSFRLFRFDSSQKIGDATVVREGRIPTVIPSCIAISPNNQVLAIGTGIGRFDNGVVILDLERNNASKPIFSEAPAAVGKIEFTEDSKTLLSTTADGMTTSFGISRNNSGLQLEQRFKMSGIEAFAITADGEAAVVKVEGNPQLLAFPMQALLDRQHDKSSFGINVQ